MERSIRRTPLIAATLALALVTGTLVGLSTSAADAAIPYPDTTRIPASSAIQAGINVSKAIYANGAATSVVLTRNDKFPDGLAASAIAGEFDGPVLFTGPSSLDPTTEAELRRVLPQGRTVFLMGGEAALSSSIANRLSGDYKIERLEGTDRVDTAALAAIRFTRSGPDGTAILVRAYGSPGQDNTEGWVDAISCGGYAADKGTPILLTNNQAPDVHPRTLDALQQIQARRVIICGGTAAVPKEHADQLIQAGYAVDRYSGSTRIGTATDVARRLWGYDSTIDRDFILVNGWGDNFAYGIAAAPLSGKTNAPIVLGNSNAPTQQPTDCPVPADAQQETLCYLLRRSNDRIASLTVVGSEALIGDPVFAAAAKAGGLPEDTAAPSVPGEVKATNTPQDDGTNVDVTWKASTDDTSGDITYTVYRREATSGDMTTENSTKAGTVKNATTFRVTGLTKQKEYQFALTATDQFGNTSALSGVATATPTDESPAAPAAAPNLQNVPTGITISWLQAPEADVAGYIVERARPVSSAPQLNPPSCSGDQFTSPSWAQVGPNITPKTNTSYTDTEVTAGQDYCYRYKVYDTSGNTTNPSPVARITKQQTTGDTTAPSSAPTIYAVQYDQQRGSLRGGPSRANTTSPRIDVQVPAGAFQAGEAQGRVKIYNGTTVVTEHTFDVTGQDQIVSVDTQMGVGDHSIQASLLDPDGNESGKSLPWELDVDTPYRSTPRILSVEGVNTDPLALADQFVPIIGQPTPFIDPTPRIVIGGLQARSYIEVYVNNTRRITDNWCPENTQDEGNTPESNGRYIINDTESDADLTVGPGQNNFVVLTYPCLNDLREQPDLNNRSGDSNTVTYLHDNSAFGVISISPGNGEFNLNGYDTFTVTFNRAATSTSKLELFDAAGTLLETVPNTGSGDDDPSASIITMTRSIDPGEYTLVVTAQEQGGAGSVNQSATFGSGFAHLVHVDASQRANGSHPDVSLNSRIAVVVEAAAPTGVYRLYETKADAEAALPNTDEIAEVEHTQGTESRANASSSTVNEDGNVATGLYWRYQPPATPQNPAPSFTAPQYDGEVPAFVSAADRQALGIRQHENSQFRVDGGSSLASRPYPFEVWYRPSTTSDDPVFGPSTSYRTSAPVRVVKTGGAFDPFNNENVAVGWDVQFFVRDVKYGNFGRIANASGDLQLDGTLRGVSAITPTNKLGGSLAPTKLEPGDTLQVDFGSPIATSAGPTTSTGGLLIFDGPDGNRKQIDPRFGTTNGASWTIGSPTSSALLITFGSQSTYNGVAIGASGAQTSGPTTLHGGDIKRGTNWLVQTVAAGGHVFILPVASAPAQNVGTF